MSELIDNIIKVSEILSRASLTSKHRYAYVNGSVVDIKNMKLKLHGTYRPNGCNIKWRKQRE